MEILVFQFKTCVTLECFSWIWVLHSDNKKINIKHFYNYVHKCVMSTFNVAFLL